MEPWYVLMVEVPLQLGKTDKVNNKCRLAILAPYITRNHEIYNGSGEVSCTFFLSHTDGWLGSRAVVDCDPTVYSWEAIKLPVRVDEMSS